MSKSASRESLGLWGGPNNQYIATSRAFAALRSTPSILEIFRNDGFPRFIGKSGDTTYRFDFVKYGTCHFSTRSSDPIMDRSDFYSAPTDCHEAQDFLESLFVDAANSFFNGTPLIFDNHRERLDKLIAISVCDRGVLKPKRTARTTRVIDYIRQMSGNDGWAIIRLNNDVKISLFNTRTGSDPVLHVQRDLEFAGIQPTIIANVRYGQIRSLDYAELVFPYEVGNINIVEMLRLTGKMHQHFSEAEIKVLSDIANRAQSETT